MPLNASLYAQEAITNDAVGPSLGTYWVVTLGLDNAGAFARPPTTSPDGAGAEGLTYWLISETDVGHPEGELDTINLYPPAVGSITGTLSDGSLLRPNIRELPENMPTSAPYNGFVHTYYILNDDSNFYIFFSATNLPGPENPICYIGESKVLVQDKETGVESQVCVKDITPKKYLVYSTSQKQFVPVKVNCISGSTDKFILIQKDLLGENKPSEDFYVTPTHPILDKKCEVEAKNLIGAKKVTLEKQLVYSLVTDNREALAINNIDVMCWEYKEFMQKYKKTKSAVWIENENMCVIQK
jgi:hypothetical protein